MVLLFFISAILELAIGIHNRAWRFRKPLLVLAVVTLGAWAGMVWVNYGLSLAVAGLGTIALYRLFNLLRIGKGRAHRDYLRFAGRRTSLILIVLHLILYLALANRWQTEFTNILAWLTAVQLLAAMTLCGVTARNLFKTKHRASAGYYSDKELPSVTVAIPARNETADLASCLQSVLASDYPKLEVLVLDDCSQDRTAEIIKDFAHDGVRFIQGYPPKSGWLAKNQAYEKLHKEASGELVLFCGVDVRFGAGAIRALVTTLLRKRRSMLSVMPLRIGGGVQTAFIQPMRYWWELVLPRRLFNRPPVLSTCWLIERKVMRDLGGMAAVRQSIIPEGYFARELIKRDGYAFIRAGESLDVRTTKDVDRQLETAVRTRYPQVKRRPENVLFLATAEAILLVLPFAIVGAGLVSGMGALHWLAALASVLLIAVHYMVMAASNPANSIIAIFNLPLVVLTELVLLHVSMFRYELGTVEWKGRNICIPVMQVSPKLPALPES